MYKKWKTGRGSMRKTVNAKASYGISVESTSGEVRTYFFTSDGARGNFFDMIKHKRNFFGAKFFRVSQEY